MGEALTPKQEAFALAYWETGNAAEAYRRAYDVTPGSRESWHYVEANQLLDNPKIASRIQDLRDQDRKLAIFNRDKALEEYEEARQLALQQFNPSAAVSATTGKVKLFGLEAPARTRHEMTGAGGGPIKTEVTSDDAFARLAGLLGSVVPGASGGTGSSDGVDGDGAA